MMNNDILEGFDDEQDEHLTFELIRISELPKCILVNLKGYADRDNNTFFRKQLFKIAKSDFKWIIIGCSDFEIHNDVVILSFDAILKSNVEKEGDIVLIGSQPNLSWYFDHSWGPAYFVRKNNLNEALEFLKKKSDGLIRFPMDFDCPICGRTMKKKSVGAHLCYGCRTILILDNCAAVSIARPQDESSLEELPQAEDDTSTET